MELEGWSIKLEKAVLGKQFLRLTHDFIRTV